MGLARKITLILIGILLIAGISISIVSYQTSYHQVDESAGIELVGCANITTGLIQPSDIEKLAHGDTSSLEAIETRLNWTVDHKPIFKEAFIISADGTILAADKRLKARGYQAGDKFYLNQEDHDMLASSHHSLYSKVYTYDGVRLKTGYGHIYRSSDPNQPIVGLMAINFDASIISDRTWEILTWPFIIGCMVLFITGAAIMIVVRRMIAPLSALSARTNLMAHGDLTSEPLGLNRRDEIGRLARDFDLMSGNLRKLILEVGETSFQVASSSEQLSASAEQSGKASEQTAAVTAELHSGADKQLRSLKDSSGAVQDMSEFIAEMAMNGHEVARAAADATEVTKSGTEAAQAAIRQMGTMNDRVQNLADIIGTLGAHSKEINNIVHIITDIADETHLLAINAAIEAARAGEHGRGFAVVASSVRKLSDRSKASAEQISTLIRLILSQMELATDTMKATAEEVNLGTQLVRSAGDSFDSIRQSSVATAHSIEELNCTLQRLSERSEQLVQTSRVIVDVAASTAGGAKEMSAAAEEQLAAAQDVSSSAEFLSELSEKMHELIERFKV
ncbi:methyl-accepting chemotaxis protein [Paenibacillus caui]|uniref:methyl-accepting chemotaxis protein n=1 Tax=Paenibacillus caui TaxID=2873927 RepID=UPI001CA8F8DF|nr:methyl-accepting chemotaxis protein [Paenibacillus caui]